jgi:hypothetical protein
LFVCLLLATHRELQLPPVRLAKEQQSVQHTGQQRSLPHPPVRVGQALLHDRQQQGQDVLVSQAVAQHVKRSSRALAQVPHAQLVVVVVAVLAAAAVGVGEARAAARCRVACLGVLAVRGFDVLWASRDTTHM